MRLLFVYSFICDAERKIEDMGVQRMRKHNLDSLSYGNHYIDTDSMSEADLYREVRLLHETCRQGGAGGSRAATQAQTWPQSGAQEAPPHGDVT